MVTRRFLTALLAAMALWSGASAVEYYKGKPILQAEWKGQEIEYVQGEILVGLKPGFSQADLLREYNSSGLEISCNADPRGFLCLETSNTESFFEMIGRLNKLESVRYAEPNQIMRLHVIPNDPSFSRQWDFHNTGQDPPDGTPDADIDAPEGWNITAGDAQIIIGVMDTGIPIQNGSLSHPDLDDPSRFIMGENIQNPGTPPIDGNGHGTHVCGTIGAETDNAIGVAGVAYNCKVMAIKTFNDDGVCTNWDLRDAIYYGVDNGCKVLNFSGGGTSPSPSEEEAIAYADSNDVVIAVSAGNTGGAVSFPAAYSLSYDNVIAVSATDHNDQVAPYSNRGPEITVAAPGGYGRPFDEDDIYSTMPNYNVVLNDEEGLPQDYAYLAGTSMAAPHVSALAGLIFSANSMLTPDSVRNIIMNTADDLGPAGFDNEYGHGRINVNNALILIGEINIGHTQLIDTKNYTSDYRVDCCIFSQSPLILDSLLLYYRIDSSSWIFTHLQQTKLLEEYYAYIPAQSPGTYIDYYMYAKNQDGFRDTTPVFTFKVIDYRIIFGPEMTTEYAASEDTVWMPLTVLNDGVLIDNYNLGLSGNQWNTSIWNYSQTSQISSTGNLTANQSLTFKIRVIIPVSVNGESDSVMVTATSGGDPSLSESVYCYTISNGAPLNIPFIEYFNTDEIDITQWVYNAGADISEMGLNEPSPPYSLHFDGYPSFGDTIMSQIILLGGAPSLNLQYAYQQTGGGESPDYDNDLFVEFLDSNHNWILINRHDGADPDMTNFVIASIPLPEAAYHDRFRIRFRNVGTYGERDDWFVDDISINSSPNASIYTWSTLEKILSPEQMATESIFVFNSGAGILQYEVEILEDFSRGGLFGQLLSQGRIEPPNRNYPEHILNLSIQKGADNISTNYGILYDAGGPDEFGYYWISSDQGGGPIFNWVDISGTGTQVSELTDDSYAGPFPIGFYFDFYGETYSEFYVSSNGFIGFGPPENYESLVNKPIPTIDVPGNFVALLWDDLNLDDANNPGGEIRYQNVDDKLIVQFINVPEYLAAAGDVFNGEIILYQNGTIRLQYLDFGSAFDKQNCTIGIEDENGFDGLEVVYCSSFLHDNLCLAFYTPGVAWLSVQPAYGSVPTSTKDTLLVQYNSRDLWSGTFRAAINIRTNDPDPDDTLWADTAQLTVIPDYYYGDANGDTTVDISDAVYIISYIFSGGQAPNPYESGDVNCDEVVNISDAVYVINYIFADGQPPCEKH